MTLTSCTGFGTFDAHHAHSDIRFESMKHGRLCNLWNCTIPTSYTRADNIMQMNVHSKSSKIVYAFAELRSLFQNTCHMAWRPC